MAPRMEKLAALATPENIAAVKAFATELATPANTITALIAMNFAAFAAFGIDKALAALERVPARVPYEPLARAQTIAVWLAHSVDPAHPLRTSLVQFYGGQASAIRASITAPDASVIARVRADFTDLLDAA